MNLSDRLKWKAVLTSLVLRRKTLYFFILFIVLLSFLRRILTSIISRWGVCSSHRSEIFQCSTEFLVYANVVDLILCYVSGDLQVALWIRLWGKMLPPIANWLKEHRSANLSPFSFIQLDPWVPFLPCFIDDSLQFLVEGIFLSWSASLVRAYIYVALDDGQFDSLIWCNWTFF